MTCQNSQGCTGRLTLAENNGQVKESNPPLSETGHDNPKVVSLLENQIADLKAQLEKSDERGDRAHHREVQTPRSDRPPPETERGPHAPSSEAKERMVATLDK